MKLKTYLIGKEIKEKMLYKLVQNPDALKYCYDFNGHRTRPDFILGLPRTIKGLLEANLIDEVNLR